MTLFKGSSSMSRLTAICLALAIAALVLPTYALIIEVPPNNQECVFEELQKNERMIASFEVLAGGMLDIDVKVFGHDGKIVYESEREQEGSFQFAAPAKGTYQLCFSNSMSTMTTKIVSFNVYAGHDLHKYQRAKTDHMQPLDRAIISLTESVRQFTDSYHYIRGRILTCHTTAKSTNRRVLWFGVLNFVMILGATAMTIYMIKRPFEQRK